MKEVAPPLVDTLTHLSMAGCLMVTEEGLRKAWTTFRNLVKFQMQESHLWLVLSSISKGKEEDVGSYSLPLRQLELTTSARNDYLTPASRVFHHLEELTLWNFEPDNSTAFTSFDNWPKFSQLSSLRLNNVAYADLERILGIIGHQLKLIDLDNFSIEETEATCVNMKQVGEFCPNLIELALTMAHIDFDHEFEKEKPQMFRNLEVISLKGNTFQTPSVLMNLLLQTPNLTSLTFFHKLVTLQHQRVPSKEPINDLKLADLLRRNPLDSLLVFQATAIDHEYGPLFLTEDSLFLLVAACPKLQKVGNLAKWRIEDIDRTMQVLQGAWGWARICS